MESTIQSFEAQIKKAGILSEALPYLQRFRGHTFVIKLGGSAMENEDLVGAVMRDIVLMEVIGINPVVVHGGGKFISAGMAEAGLEPHFIGGMRVTDEESIKIVDRTLNETINSLLVSQMSKYGGHPLGLKGQEVFVGEKTNGMVDGEPVDLGYVGKVTNCNLERLHEAMADEKTPVLSPLARNQDGGDLPLNINADLAASALAKHMKATKLVYLSDVLGVMRDFKDPNTLISSIDEEGAENLIEEGIIQGGMIPKVRSSLDALHAGVGKVHMIDGRIPHSLLLEVFTDIGIGTEIVLAT
tara:strand:- start:450 stop:1349 length:900 start_codon:yes stop_codon:yes gene_type:complete